MISDQRRQSDVSESNCWQKDRQNNLSDDRLICAVGLHRCVVLALIRIAPGFKYQRCTSYDVWHMKRGTLELHQIVEAVELLRNRIGERFPNSGLKSHAGELVEFSQLLKKKGRKLVGVSLGVRIISWLGGIFVIVLIVIPYFFFVKNQSGIETLPNFLQSLEAVITVIAGTSAAFIAMISIKRSHIRKKALALLHLLREIAHVIDMLQLSKSPAAVMFPLEPTAYSRPATETFSQGEMFRYLSYCGEISALLGKLSVIISGWVPDPAVLSAADDVQNLASDLERKMLSKLLLLEQINQRVRPNP